MHCKKYHLCINHIFAEERNKTHCKYHICINSNFPYSSEVSFRQPVLNCFAFIKHTGCQTVCFCSFSDVDQADLSNQAVCMDPVYDVLWG